MKIYQSLDFEASKKRVEPYAAGDYIVHAEDYEDINELVQRCIITKSKLPDFTSSMAQYDPDNEPILSDRSSDKAVEPSEEAAEGKHSEPASPLPDGSIEPLKTPK